MAYMQEITTDQNEKTAEDFVSSEEDRKNLPILQEMIKAGVFYGRKKEKTHPLMKPSILTSKNSLEIIDLSETLRALAEVEKFLRELFGAKKDVKALLVGTHPAAADIVKNLAEKFSFPYVNTRWIGGTLTNFKTINGRVNFFKDLKAKKKSRELEKYTKKERLMIDRDIERMEKIFSGIESMSQLPDVLIVFNAKLHETAVKEAKIMKIPVVAIVNTDTNPTMIDFPIPANDNIKSSIVWIASYLEKVFDGVSAKK